MGGGGAGGGEGGGVCQRHLHTATRDSPEDLHDRDDGHRGRLRERVQCEWEGEGEGEGREVEYVNVTSTLLHVTALKTYVTEMTAREGGFTAEFSVSGGSGLIMLVRFSKGCYGRILLSVSSFLHYIYIYIYG